MEEEEEEFSEEEGEVEMSEEGEEEITSEEEEVQPKKMKQETTNFTSEQLLPVEKEVRKVLNRVTEGNIEPMFRQILEIIK